MKGGSDGSARRRSKVLTNYSSQTGRGLSDPEIFYSALADRWPTAFQRVGAEPWVIHRPGPLRPGPQRTGTESSSWKAEGTAVFSRSARAKKGQIDEQNR